ncbi:AEC family transporter [Campylobacter sp. faydin G-140]|uniref:AEC family transporter n=1 Tax=Campylobacter anatolicus TaxID=2829105 RepID=UPI001B9CEED9|nr:AEC family transporter [Campylobacter anatolicus]MBR8465808.1 AEC family transporter [Campylobacter anatolicus]
MNLIPLFSIFVMISTGFFAKKVKIVETKHSVIFVDFVLCFAIPALVFDKIYHVTIDTTLINSIATGFLSSIFGGTLALVLGCLFKFSRATIVSMVMLSIFGNTLFVGLPVLQGFFGDEVLNEVIFYDQLATAIPLSILGPLILSFGASEKVSLFANAVKILKFPPFIALICAFMLKGFYIPDFIFAPLRMFSGAITPIALFAIGIGLSFNSIRSSYKGLFIVIFCKMIAPALFIIAVINIFSIHIDTKWIVAIFQASMPPMVLASAMIMKAGLDSSLAISSVAMGVTFSFVSLPVLFYIFGV